MDTENPKQAVVLIVDDNDDSRFLLDAILQEANYLTALAESGKEMLELIKRQKPDLILLDVLMPGMDGFQVCRQLRSDPSFLDVPVIFLTAKTDENDILQGFEAGAVDYVTKPFNPPELLARVRTHVELKRAREEIRTLKGTIPICANCKSIRNEHNEWQPLERYIKEHTEAGFSHGLCPTCLHQLYPEIADEVINKNR